MTFDTSVVVTVIIAAGSMLIYVGRTLEAMRSLTASNKDQGKRIGLLEDFKAGIEKVAEYKAQRTLSRAHGVPISEDETPT